MCVVFVQSNKVIVYNMNYQFSLSLSLSLSLKINHLAFRIIVMWFTHFIYRYVIRVYNAPLELILDSKRPKRVNLGFTDTLHVALSLSIAHNKD